MSGPIVFGIDIGGSGVKGAPVDVPRGELAVPKRHRIKTPQPSTPDAVMDVAAEVASHFDWHGPIGCAFPAVVRNGVVLSAANVDDSWIGVNGRDALAKRTGCDVHLLNDADAAGIAEIEAGAGRGVAGVVMLLTFGTGIGSALFNDGHLVPNTELGHIEFRGDEAEHLAAARFVEDDGMPLDEWAGLVSSFLRYLDALFSPDLFIIGGGISKRFDDFSDSLDVDAEVVPAMMRNNAGIVGAALAGFRAFGGRDGN